MIASDVQGRRDFFALGSVNAEATNKDANYLCKWIEDYLDHKYAEGADMADTLLLLLSIQFADAVFASHTLKQSVNMHAK